MSRSKTTDEASQFDRECRAAKNRLGEVRLQEITTREITHNGQTLRGADLRVLAIIVEEEHSLDPILGLAIDGVSRSAVGDLMGYDDNKRSGYRFEKLEEAGLIDQFKVDDLPIQRTGIDPKYAVPTGAGRRVADELGLVPILTRDRDVEEEFDMLVSDHMKLREEFIRALGRQILLAQQLSDDEADDLGEFSFDAMGSDLMGLGESVLVDLPSELSLSDDEYAFGKLLGEMDEAERELMMRELLDEMD